MNIYFLYKNNSKKDFFEGFFLLLNPRRHSSNDFNHYPESKDILNYLSETSSFFYL